MTTKEYKTIEIDLNGKESFSIPIKLKKNGRLIEETVDIIVRGFLKFSDIAETDTTLYESKEFNKQTANDLENKTIVHPVLFTSDKITVYNGETTITLLPRSEDLLNTIEEITTNSSTNEITNNQLINNEISVDEQLINPETQPAIIVVRTGEIRRPYKISIEVSVIPHNTIDGLTGKTIDRGTNPQINEETEVTSLFSKYQKRIASNFITDHVGKRDWIPSINKILYSNSDNSQTLLDEITTLSYNTPFGASLFYDAIISGTTIMTDNSLNDIRKVIYAFTDNEANISIASSDNVIEEANKLNGIKETPIMISNVNIADKNILAVKDNITDNREINKISYESGGQALTVTNREFIDDIVNILYSSSVGAMGYGTYELLIELEEVALINSITANFDIPIDNADATWTFEHSEDGYTYTEIGENYNENESYVPTELYAKYIRIKATLVMGFYEDGTIVDEYNPYPSSPSLTSVEVVYNNANIKYLYLNEEEGITPYHLSLAVDSNEVNTEQILGGLAKSNAINWNDYFSDSQLTVNQNGKVIIPIRVSSDPTQFSREILNKVDQFTLKTEYGSIDPTSTIILYDKENEIIESGAYKVYPRDGIIIMGRALDSDYQDGDYKIDVINSNVYKIGFKITNKSSDTDLDIYGIGYMYSRDKILAAQIQKTSPEVFNVEINNESPDRYSIIEGSYDYSDINNDAESGSIIKWFLNSKHLSYLDGMLKWNNIRDAYDPIYTETNLQYPTSSQLENDSFENIVKKQDIGILKSGDNLWFSVIPSDGELFGDEVKSNEILVKSYTPIISPIFIRGRDSDGNLNSIVRTNTTAVLNPSLSNSFYSDGGANLTEVIWIVNNEIFKRGKIGDISSSGIPITELRINELGKEKYKDYGLRIGNSLFVQIIPKTESGVGTLFQTPTVIINNSLPEIFHVSFKDNSFREDIDIELNWEFYDFDITSLGDIDPTGQEDRTQVQIYRQNSSSQDLELIYIYNDQENNLVETFKDISYKNYIKTNISDHSCRVNHQKIFKGQIWKFVLTPYDTIDNGSIVSKTITITSKSN